MATSIRTPAPAARGRRSNNRRWHEAPSQRTQIVRHIAELLDHLGVAEIACGGVTGAAKRDREQKSITDEIVGAWSLVAVTAELSNGNSVEPFGANPRGTIIFTPDGQFALFQSRSELPKIASNDRTKATPGEAAAIVGGSIAYYGTYSVNEADKSLSVNLEGSTFANLLGGPAQKRLITSLDASELKSANPKTPSGMTLRTVWKRTGPVKCCGAADIEPPVLRWAPTHPLPLHSRGNRRGAYERPPGFSEGQSRAAGAAASPVVAK